MAPILMAQSPAAADVEPGRQGQRRSTSLIGGLFGWISGSRSDTEGEELAPSRPSAEPAPQNLYPDVPRGAFDLPQSPIMQGVASSPLRTPLPSYESPLQRSQGSDLFHPGSAPRPRVFQNNSPFSAARSSGRRHRPIYFGPGMSLSPRKTYSPQRTGMRSSQSLSSLAAHAPAPATPEAGKRRKTDAESASEHSKRAAEEADHPAPKTRRIEPVRTRAASAMLAVLEDAEPVTKAPVVPEIVNPYQGVSKPTTSPSRPTASPKSNRTRALEAARTRARERRKSEPKRESLLELVERTAPAESEPHEDEPAVSSPHLERLTNKPKRPSPLSATVKGKSLAEQPEDEPSKAALGTVSGSVHAPALVTKDVQTQTLPEVQKATAPIPAPPKGLILNYFTKGTFANTMKTVASQIPVEKLPKFDFDVTPEPFNTEVSQRVSATPASNLSFGTSQAATPGVLSSGLPQAKPVEKPAFSFGSSGKPAEKPAFSFGSADKPTEKPAFSFGSAGKPAEKPAFSFGSAGKPVEKPAFSFGSTDKPTEKPAFSFGSAGKPAEKPAFSFGSAEKPTDKPMFSFRSSDKPSFSFGTTGKLPEKPVFSFGSNPTDKPAFSFGASAPAEKPATETPQSSEATSTVQPETQHASESEAPSTFTAGEGEENETTEHEARVKIWRLVQGKWADQGVTVFRIKKNKETAKCRILARNAVNGNVVLNFNLYASMNVSRDKGVLTFLGFDEAKPVNLRCKLKTEDAAEALKAALKEHVPSE